MNPDAIGGYFGLELPAARHALHADALRFQTARAAWLALLQAGRPRAVWMPWYICDTMLEPLRMAQVEIKRYGVDARLRVEPISIASDEWLLYVNYFGLCADNVADVLNRFPPGQVVIDHSQSLFSAPAACLATLYSPRKFVGVPDGGYLVTDHHVEPPLETDEGSVDRFPYLLKRLNGGAEAGYADYAAAEASLHGQPPRRMSALTRTLLSCVDYETVRVRRIENYRLLDDRLASANRHRFALADRQAAAPMCYPFSGAREDARAALARMRVYTPCYWPDVASTPQAPDIERRFAARTLFLPCDQRLTQDQVEHMARLVLDQLE